jgi:hypothetical protein
MYCDVRVVYKVKKSHTKRAQCIHNLYTQTLTNGPRITRQSELTQRRLGDEKRPVDQNHRRGGISRHKVSDARVLVQHEKFI